MKQINYLLLVTILFFSNCSKDNGVDEILSEKIVNITEANSITEADLVGDWLFDSLEFKGKTYTECDDELRKKYNLLNLSFLDVTLSEHGVATLTYYSDCGERMSSKNDEDKKMKFKIEDKKIIFNNDNDYAYSILNYDEFNGETLRLELLKKSSILPTGGIYTLHYNEND